MKKFEDCDCMCHRIPGITHIDACCDQTYKVRTEGKGIREQLKEDKPLVVGSTTKDKLKRYIQDIFFSKKPSRD